MLDAPETAGAAGVRPAAIGESGTKALIPSGGSGFGCHRMEIGQAALKLSGKWNEPVCYQQVTE